MQVPTIREVYTVDEFVKGKIKKYEVVDVFDYDLPNPEYSAYTEREATDFIMGWLDG